MQYPICPYADFDSMIHDRSLAVPCAMQQLHTPQVCMHATDVLATYLISTATHVSVPTAVALAVAERCG